MRIVAKSPASWLGDEQCTGDNAFWKLENGTMLVDNCESGTVSMVALASWPVGDEYVGMFWVRYINSVVWTNCEGLSHTLWGVEIIFLFGVQPTCCRGTFEETSGKPLAIADCNSISSLFHVSGNGSVDVEMPNFSSLSFILFIHRSES